MAGIPTLDAWTADLANASERIETQLNGTIKEAWELCLPTWINLGRVRDLSRAVRVPKYFPSYGNQLGQAFAYKFRQEDVFLANILRESPIDSHEYLIACDLLDMIVCESVDDPDVHHERIFQLAFDVPPVLRRELSHKPSHYPSTTIGALLRKLYQDEWSDDG